ncbi:transporter [Frigoribacterium faeni]|uniref:ABC-2 type transport system permease protein n=1 Tax=Frigoribacterium faeni TaxID=145483 RepID=A0A7W3JJT9_9MICO|nr:transporter [Frigoribacterium faeni]MBA8814162.1 ABC-2 type transport system permease protein [Frigoribacterium faeni]BFF16211.1 hypothetical protein GCM10025699_75140 [Microbacterium flavescens]GEK84151.1 hypothetical protein FFA01_24600 [Frigoribacterium faeni]
MVAHLLSLRWRVMLNGFSRSTWQLVAAIIGLLYGLGILGVVVAGLVSLSFAPEGWAWTAAVLGGSVTVLGWVLVPLLLRGLDQTLSMDKLRSFPIPADRLLVALLVCGVLGVPGLVTTIAGVATALSWLRDPVALIVAPFCAVVGVLTCIAASRAVESITASFGNKRRYRELMSVLIFVPLLLAFPLISIIGSGLSVIGGDLPEIARTLSFTPLGAAWSIPGDLAAGRGLEALAKAGIALATLALLLLLWRRGLAASLIAPPTTDSATTSKGLGPFRWFPATPTGAVAARAAVYWLRDPRYGGSLITVPLIPVLAIFISVTSGSDWLLYAIGPVVGALLMITLSAEISYDGTAFAAHLSTGLSGRADRAGRVLTLSLFSVPTVLLATVVPLVVLDRLDLVPVLLGLALGVMLTGFGVSSVASTRFLMPVPEAGQSPFKSPQGSTLTTALITYLVWIIAFACAAPTIALAIAALITGSALLGWLTLVVGVGLGTALLFVGIDRGGKSLDARGPELLSQLRRASGG